MIMNELFIKILDGLQDYSNLLLVVVTVIYVVLTYWLVRETRRAREAEVEPELVASLIPIGGNWLVKLRINNVGNGPALGIKAKFRLEPANDVADVNWFHPVLISGAFEDFRMPGGKHSLKRLSEEHDKLIIEMSWINSFKKKKEKKVVFDFKSMIEGWSEVRMLLPPEEISTQLGQIKDELARIKTIMQNLETERLLGNILVVDENEAENDETDK